MEEFNDEMRNKLKEGKKKNNWGKKKETHRESLFKIDESELESVY